jgi:ABC-type microcin C transport system permease subunit YejB
MFDAAHLRVEIEKQVQFQIAIFSAFIVYLVCCFSVGYGMLKFKENARKMTIFYSSVITIGAAYSLGSNNYMVNIIECFLMGLFGFVIFYLTRPKIRERFK